MLMDRRPAEKIGDIRYHAEVGRHEAAEALLLKLAHHARAAIGAVRQSEGRAKMRQENQIFLLAPAGRAAAPMDRLAGFPCKSIIGVCRTAGDAVYGTLAQTPHLAGSQRGRLADNRSFAPKQHKLPCSADHRHKVLPLVC